MKIGILAYRQYPYVSANTHIAYIIGQQLCDFGNEVVYIGRKQNVVQNDISNYQGNKIRYLNDKIKEDNVKRTGLFNKLALKLSRGEVASSRETRSDAKTLKKIVSEEGIDVIITFIAPLQDAFIATKAKIGIPIILYQLDPFYNLNDIIIKRNKKKFLNLLDKVKFCFTTAPLFERCKNDKDFKKHLCKMQSVEFPKLVESSYSNPERVQEKSTLLYAGTLYTGIRSPDILIDLKNLLQKYSEIIFCGGCDRQEDLRRITDSGIIFKGRLDVEELQQEYQNASILINIGNNVSIQMGSKIIDYIATGKPILHIKQLDDDPCEEYLTKYPYSLIVSAKELKNKTTNNKIIKFIDAVAGKKADFKEIKNKFYNATPEYVGKVIETKIEEILK